MINENLKHNERLFVFGIDPAAVSGVSGLKREISSFLNTLSYRGSNISEMETHTIKAIELRYVRPWTENSLAKVILSIVLFIKVEINEKYLENSDKLIGEISESINNLLYINLHKYGYKIEEIDISDPQNYHTFIEPFHIRDVVEFSRRIKKFKPFKIEEWGSGEYNLTKVMDMMLREKYECYLSILFVPEELTDDEQSALDIFDFRSPIKKYRPPEDIREIQIDEDPRTIFDDATGLMKIRLVGTEPLSLLLVNTVGAELSGHRPFLYYRVDNKFDLKRETHELRTFSWSYSGMKNIDFKAAGNVAELLKKVLYMFPVAESTAAFQLPTERMENIKQSHYKELKPPVYDLPNIGLRIGKGIHPSYKDPLNMCLLDRDRRRHMYVVGKTGTGKSFFLQNMIYQDIKNGKGICIIDPHGDLIDRIMLHIPEKRINDVILFDPSHNLYVPGLNLLQTISDDPAEKDFIVQETVSIVERLMYDPEWFGPRLQDYFINGCLTLMEKNPQGSLLELPRLFIHKKFQEEMTKEIKDPLVRSFWKDQMQQTGEREKQEMIPYFASKFNPFFNAYYIRLIIGQQYSSINFQNIMDTEKILLVNLSKGKIGERNAHLLGLIIVSKLLWAATRRAFQTERKRKDFFLYVDEFQNFVTQGFLHILSEARKYRLNLIIANQHLKQLSDISTTGIAITNSIFGNVGNIVSFRLGSSDSELMAKEFGEPAQTSSFQYLENRKAVARLLIRDEPTLPFNFVTIEEEENPIEDNAEDIKKEIERKQIEKGYWKHRNDIIEELEARFDIKSTKEFSF